jgi:hypothetical protein
MQQIRDTLAGMLMGYLDPGSGSLLAWAILVWVVPALLVARLAQRQGQGFVAYLFIGLFLSWVIALVTLGVALIVQSRRSAEEAASAWTPDT